MRISLYKIRTYAQLDTWSRGSKQSQTKPISPDLPLPSQQKTSLTFLLTKTYATTPESQKQSQTKPISTKASRSAVQIHRNQTTSHDALNPSAKSASSGFPAAAVKIAESIVRRRDAALYLTSLQKNRNRSPICRKGNGL